MSEFEHYCIQQVAQLVLKRTNDAGEFECWIYNGPVKTKARNGLQYGTVTKTIRRGDEVKKFNHFYAHRAVKLYAEHQVSNPRSVSHLCHQTLCVNPEHLEFESTGINNNRKPCNRTGWCNQHTDSDDKLQPSCFL